MLRTLYLVNAILNIYLKEILLYHNNFLIFKNYFILSPYPLSFKRGEKLSQDDFGVSQNKKEIN